MSITSETCAVCGLHFEPEELEYAVPWERRHSPERVEMLRAHPHCARRVKAQVRKEGWLGPKDTGGGIGP